MLLAKLRTGCGSDGLQVFYLLGEAGPFSPLAGGRYRYVLMVMDLYSRHVQVVPLEDKWVETVAEAMVFRVLLEHGVPEVLFSNQGTEFKNQLMRNISKYFRTTQRFTLMIFKGLSTLISFC